MLKRISKRVTNTVDKLQMSAVVHLNRIFWDDTRNDRIVVSEEWIGTMWRNMDTF